jgi:signal transduction histidine kinase
MSDIITTVKGLATNMNTSETAEFTADELMKRVFLLMQQELKRGKCRMEFTNDLPPAVKITGDVNNLVQVLSNLVGNAVDAMPAGGEIKAHAFLKDDAICLSVSDQGMGVPPNIKEKLFKEMFTSKGAKGTGLGLYMSAALMRGKFGGKLWLEQTSHSGSTFCLSIPHSDNPEEGREKHAEE